MNYLSVVVSSIPALGLRAITTEFTPLCVGQSATKNFKIVKVTDRWTWTTLSRRWCEYISTSTRLVSKRWQRSSAGVAAETGILRRDDLHSTELLICNTVGCLMQQPGGIRSLLLLRKDQSVTSVATTVNLFVALQLNYSFEMRILVLADCSGGSVMLKRSLRSLKRCRGEFQALFQIQWTYQTVSTSCSREVYFFFEYFLFKRRSHYNVLYASFASYSHFPDTQTFGSQPAVLNFSTHYSACLLEYLKHWSIRGIFVEKNVQTDEVITTHDHQSRNLW